MASTSAQVSLNAVSTGTGSTVDFTTAKSIVTAVLSPSKGGLGGIVSIEASQDSTVWVPMASVEPDRGVARGVEFRGVAYRYWRARVLSDVVGGGSVTVTFMEAG